MMQKIPIEFRQKRENLSMLLGVELLTDTYLNGEEQWFKHINS